MARPSYTIRGGQADADRLARQAAVMAPATRAFLTRVGLRPGWACLDVGCGDGQVTVELARAAGPRGRAVGLDLDPDALTIARPDHRPPTTAGRIALVAAYDGLLAQAGTCIPLSKIGR
jgi:ubiquinone/menaquinone biosynthesis C-methylase UbiE